MLKEIKNIIRTLVLTAGDSKDRSGRDVRFFFSFFSFGCILFPSYTPLKSSCSFSASRRLLNVDALPLVLGTYK
jgi:hypothetical protein